MLDWFHEDPDLIHIEWVALDQFPFSSQLPTQDCTVKENRRKEYYPHFLYLLSKKQNANLINKVTLPVSGDTQRGTSAEDSQKGQDSERDWATFF